MHFGMMTYLIRCNKHPRRFEKDQAIPGPVSQHQLAPQCFEALAIAAMSVMLQTTCTGHLVASHKVEKMLSMLETGLISSEDPLTLLTFWRTKGQLGALIFWTTSRKSPVTPVPERWGLEEIDSRYLSDGEGSGAPSCVSNGSLVGLWLQK